MGNPIEYRACGVCAVMVVSNGKHRREVNGAYRQSETHNSLSLIASVNAALLCVVSCSLVY